LSEGLEMPIPKSEKIWFNGELVDWDDAQIHVLSHVVHYGSSVFEGMRCYATEKGTACFRLQDHVNRLYDSAKIYRMDIPFDRGELAQAVLDTIRANNLKACYVRPIVFRGYGELGVNPAPCPVEVAVAVWEWGKYLGPEALEKGVSARVSSWNRPAPNTMPSLAKVGANYMNSQLIKMEALADGYAEGIALDTSGYVSEGSGENIFIVKNGAIYTPSTGSSILPGITRHSVITLAEFLGYRITTRPIPRESLYIADEVFFTGSAAEITPIAQIDHIQVGSGSRGPVTEALQTAFFDLIEGRADDNYKWLTYV
jgi:branched-chain amino acid aminotransferase